MTSRSVAITGAGGGIGRAVAKMFADAGDQVYLADMSEKRLDEAIQAIGSDRVHGHVVDVTDFGSVQNLVKTVVDETGQLDVFVNNAGVFDGVADINETGPELWDKIIAVNLTGCFNGVKAASEPMIARQQGRIINIGSIAARRALADGIAYTAAKAGIEGLTRRLAFDVARHGITANVVAPGSTATDIRANSEQILGDLVTSVNRGVGASADLMDLIIPARRKGTPDEMAATVFFLASEGAAYITGQVIYVDGGWFAS